jgi:hypothetical protein
MQPGGHACLWTLAIQGKGRHGGSHDCIGCDRDRMGHGTEEDRRESQDLMIYLIVKFKINNSYLLIPVLAFYSVSHS